MIERTIFVVGPGGVGKSPLDAVFRDDVIRIDPYRLRTSGPRDSSDVFYAHPRLRAEWRSVLAALGDQAVQIGSRERPVEWFPRSQVLFLKVRHIWQLLPLRGLAGQLAKVEMHAPVLPALLSNPDVSSLLGNEKAIIILNPAPESVTGMQDWNQLEEKTRQNCTRRGDSPESIAERAGSTADEALAWRWLIQEHAATEYTAWEFPEYLYREPPPGLRPLEHRKHVLLQARQRLLSGNPDLRVFLKGEEQIDA